MDRGSDGDTNTFGSPRFSLRALLLLVAICSIALALLTWRFALGVVLLGIGAGIALLLAGVSRKRRGIGLLGASITLLLAMVLLYDAVVQTTWMGSCGFSVPVVVSDTVSGEAVEGAGVIVGGASYVFEETDFNESFLTDEKGEVTVSVRYGCGGSESGLRLTNPGGWYAPDASDFGLCIQCEGYEPIKQRLPDQDDQALTGMKPIIIKLQPKQASPRPASRPTPVPLP